jgi:single-stranded DNA-binding protein
MSFNKVFLMGEIKKITPIESKGVPVVSFMLKVWEKERKELVDCVAYSEIAKIIQSSFSEGSTIFIEGKIHTYLDDGHKMSQVIVEKFKNYDIHRHEY